MHHGATASFMVLIELKGLLADLMAACMLLMVATIGCRCSGATGCLCLCGAARDTPVTASLVIQLGSLADLPVAAYMLLSGATTGCRCSELSVVGLFRVRESSRIDQAS
jgi:hypothetical protein